MAREAASGGPKTRANAATRIAVVVAAVDNARSSPPSSSSSEDESSSEKDASVVDRARRSGLDAKLEGDDFAAAATFAAAAAASLTLSRPPRTPAAATRPLISAVSVDDRPSAVPRHEVTIASSEKAPTAAPTAPPPEEMSVASGSINVEVEEEEESAVSPRTLLVSPPTSARATASHCFFCGESFGFVRFQKTSFDEREREGENEGKKKKKERKKESRLFSSPG